MRLLAICCVLLPVYAFSQSNKGIVLSDLSWVEAEKALTKETIIVIPLGAASKEHGPHLLLKNDLILAEYLTARVLREAEVVIAPTINYHFYPSFLEYPGSTSLRLGTARDMVVDICRSLAAYGPKKFYILNTGISTVRALNPARDTLANDGITMRFTDLNDISEVEDKIKQEEGGTHADEIETSMILYMRPKAVDMQKAVKDYTPNQGKGLTRNPNNKASTYSPSGVWGDATLASYEKGRIVTEALVELILDDIRKMKE